MNSSKIVGQPIMDFYIGVDLGQSQDYTAVCVVEKIMGRKDFTPHGSYLEDLWYSGGEIEYLVPHLQRFPLGTSYPAIVRSVGKMVQSLPIAGRGTVDGKPPQRVLVLDGTGVGRAITDLFRDADVGDVIMPIGIHGGVSVTTGADGYVGVPKSDLIASLQVLMQRGRLRVASGLSDARTLLTELKDYRYTITQAANTTFDARSGQHDDLVLSLGVTVWAAQRGIGVGSITPEAMAILEEWT